MRDFKVFIYILSLLSFVCFPAFSQKIETDFGQNRIQYKSKDWKYFDSKNFSFHFYGEYDQIAKEAIEYLEDRYDKITEDVGFSPYMKLKVFLYASNSDLLQSNVGLNYDMFTINGKTQFVRTYIELAHSGTTQDLKDELNFHIYKLIIQDMMASNALENFMEEAQSNKIPTWFVDGAARYLAYGWDEEMDAFVRSLMKKKRVHLETFTNENASLIGQSVWNYIAQKYRKDNVANILDLTRMLEDEEKGIAKTLGLDYDEFLKGWKSYYTENNNVTNTSYVDLNDKKRIKRNWVNAQYTGLSFSPDGKNLVYGQNNHGKIVVKLRSIEDGSERTIINRFYRTPNQENKPKYPLVAWKDNNTIGVIASEFGSNWIWLYNTENREIKRRQLPKKINQINSLQFFKKNGRLALLSAEAKGKTDIYALSLTRFSVKSLMKDVYDDIDPTFIPDKNAFLFSSNRTQITGNPKQKSIDFDSISNDYNLYTYSFDSIRGKRISLVKHSVGFDKMPKAVDAKMSLFLADYQGIMNLYSYNSETDVVTQISKFNYGIKQYAYHHESKKLALVSFRNGKEQLYIIDDFDIYKNQFSESSPRKKAVLKEKFRNRIIAAKEKEIADSLEILKLSLAKEKEEKLLEKEAKRAKEARNKQLLPEKYPDFRIGDSNHFVVQNTSSNAEKIDTDNYKFHPQALEATKPRMSYLMKYRMQEEDTIISGPLPYKEKFRIDNMSMAVIIDPYWGNGVESRFQVNDLLEDHRFILNLRTNFEFSNGDLDFSYHYLKKILDFKARYFRKVIKANPNNQSGVATRSTYEQKYKLNRFELGASLPFSTFSRLELNPFYTNTNFHSLITPNSTSIDTSISHHFTGAELAFVFDNTEILSLNSYKGLRSKLSFESYQGISKGASSFSNLNFDTRFYFPIYKEIVIASRFFYGRYFGKGKKSYLLGGVDNWLFSKTKGQGEESSENNPLGVDPQNNNEDLLFLNYVTGLRGFDYNTLNGENALTFNAEFRLPLFKTLSKKQINSNFFRNFNFVTFFDVGSAWNGSKLLPDDENINTRLVQGAPATGASPNSNAFLEIRVKDYSSPWLASYGAGIHTSLFGYQLKAEYAKPLTDVHINRPRFLISFGREF